MSDTRPSDVNYPSTVSLDSSSKATLSRAQAGNTACGLMSLPDGVIYLAPYSPFQGAAAVAGQPIEPLIHNNGGQPGHEQLAIFLNDKARISPRQGYIGFSVLYSSLKGGVGGTSRSQNNQHFRDWAFKGQDEAFSAYHAGNFLQGEQLTSAPAFHDVTIPSTGELPAQWRDEIKSFLISQLGSTWSDSIVSRTESVVIASNAPTAPPYNPTNKPYRASTKQGAGI